MSLARRALALAFIAVAALFAYNAIKFGWAGGYTAPVRFAILPALGFLGAAWAVWPRA